MICGAYEATKKADGSVDVKKFLGLDKPKMAEVLAHLKQIGRMDLYNQLRLEVVQTKLENEQKGLELRESVAADIATVNAIDYQLAQLNNEKSRIIEETRERSLQIISELDDSQDTKKSCCTIL